MVSIHSVEMTILCELAMEFSEHQNSKVKLEHSIVMSIKFMAVF